MGAMVKIKACLCSEDARTCGKHDLDRLESIISAEHKTCVFVYDRISTAGTTRRAFSGDDVGIHAHPFYQDGCVLANELVYCNRTTRQLRYSWRLTKKNIKCERFYNDALSTIEILLACTSKPAERYMFSATPYAQGALQALQLHN